MALVVVQQEGLAQLNAYLYFKLTELGIVINLNTFFKQLTPQIDIPIYLDRHTVSIYVYID